MADVKGTELPAKVDSVRVSPTSGLKVSKIILGCMSYGSKSWVDWVIEDQDEVTKHIKSAYDMGIYTLDCANVYSFGESERLVGNAIKTLGIDRRDLVIMTKVNMLLKDRKEPPQGFQNYSGLSRKHIFDSVHASLERLQLDYVDVLQCHRFDYETPVEETMDALHDLVKSGLVRYIGMSSCYAYQFAQMQYYAKMKGQTQFITMQDFYTAVYREEEREMIPMCRQLGVGIIPWSPLARGFLTRPHTESSHRAKTDKNFGVFVGVGDPTQTEALNAINEAVERVAKKRGHSMAQIALAWVLAQPGVTAPIVGSTKLESIKELVQATHIKLTDEEIEEIKEHYKPRRIYGHS